MSIYSRKEVLQHGIFCRMTPVEMQPAAPDAGEALRGGAMAAPKMQYRFGTCITQQCGHWRWWDTVASMTGKDPNDRRGYCGLAGRPVDGVED